MRQISRLCSIVTVLACLGGCTKTVIKRVARYDVNHDSITAIVPQTGVYKVKYASTRSKDAVAVADSSRILHEGDRVGFRRTDDGAIFAIAGAEEFRLHDLPGDVTRFCWYHRHKQPTEFARNMTAAMEAGGELTKGAAFAAGAGAVIVGEAMLNGIDDDDDCEPPQPPKHRDHLRH